MGFLERWSKRLPELKAPVAGTIIEVSGHLYCVSFKVVTVCEIRDALEAENITARSEITWHWKDRFDLHAARKIAFARALLESGMSKPVRAEFWRELRKFGQKKLENCIKGDVRVMEKGMAELKVRLTDLNRKRLLLKAGRVV